MQDGGDLREWRCSAVVLVAIGLHATSGIGRGRALRGDEWVRLLVNSMPVLRRPVETATNFGNFTTLGYSLAI